MAEIATRYERTSPDYPTYGPADTGETWHEFFKRVKKKDDEEVPVVEFKVRQEAVEIPVGELPAAVKGIAGLMTKAGFAVQAKRSQTWEEGAVFKTGKQAGEKRPDKLVDHWAILGKMDDLLGGSSIAMGVWQGATLAHAERYEIFQAKTPLRVEFANVTEFKAYLKGVAE